MPLTLSVPDLTDRSADDADLQPSAVRKWLDALPLLNVNDSALKLSTRLSLLNRIDHPDSQRLELLELFRPVIGQLSQELTRQYVGQTQPFSEKHAAIANLNRLVQTEMANGYKRLAVNLSLLPIQGTREQKRRAQVVKRAIRYLTHSLLVSYQTYAPSPEGIWREIHMLHQHAEEEGFADIDIEDDLNEALPKISVHHAYKQALLLYFCDPYHLAPRMIDAAHHYLDRWASLSQFTTPTEVYNPTCQFLIDRQGDTAGMAYATGSHLTDTARYRLLSTVELARQIHTHLTQIQNGQKPPTDGLSKNFFQEFPDLLRRLITVWGVNPQRAYRRAEGSQALLEIAIGMERINYWVNGGKHFVVSSSFVGPMPKPSRFGTESAHKKNIPLPEQELTTWTIHDQSAGGMSLSHHGLLRLPIQVGDLLITRPVGAESTWTVAVIRWIRSNGATDVEIGIQNLAPRSDPVVVKTISEKGIESNFLPALLLPEVTALKQTQTLVTHRGVYRPGAKIYMDDGCRLNQVIPTQIIEVNRSFEQFGFEILKT